MRRLALGLLLMGCEGAIGGPGVRAPVEDPPTTPPTVVAPKVFAPAPAGLKRLTVEQYRNSVVDLLGTPLTVPADLEADTPVDGLSTVGASDVPISARGVEQFDAAARAMAAEVFATPARRVALVGCTPAAGDAPCVRTFLARFGERAWRRPLESAELDRYVALSGSVATTLADVWKGPELAVATLLASPNFLHRVELIAPDAAHPGWFRYDASALATRLSYFLWNTTPDAALLAAARTGELDTADGLRTQVDRLLGDPRTKPALLTFFADQLGLGALDRLERDPALFPGATATLGASMRQELDRFIGLHALEPGRDFRHMLSTPDTFANAELAALYGVAAPASGFGAVRFSSQQPRAGLLGTAGVLALTSHPYRTSPTGRGVFVRRKLLCETIAPPPPNVSNSVDGAPAPTGTTLADRLAQHRADPVCASCHAKLDPVGLGLEAFDAVGAHRTTDNGGHIDSNGQLDGRAFVGASGLGTLLENDPRIPACVSKRLYNHAVGRVLTAGDGAAIDAVATELQQHGYSVLELARAITQSDGFRLASGQR
ncbi:MAG: DUF1592 domain-containing protein [Archangiaceae bacterium]|nr:DUF1592 domain-containing protein [Archangiaceae bacterium]